jgi:iron complex transport system substrate-binding protein
MWFRLFSRLSPLGGTEALPALLLSMLVVSFFLGTEAQALQPVRGCVTDHLSHNVCLSRAPRRVISLAPSLTETLFALNAGSLLVGRSARCNYPPEASQVPVVGAYMSPDLERVMDSKPDLVIAPKAGIKNEVLTRLARLDIPVFVDDSRNLDDIRDLVRKLGLLLDRETEAERIIEQFDQRRTSAQQLIRTQPTPLVLFAVGSSPLVVAGGKSFLGSLIREAGGKNIAENERIPFPKLSIEEVLRKDPDIILVLDKECTSDRCIEGWRRHRRLKAVRAGRVYVMEGDLMARPSPRIVEGLWQLTKILHPEAFSMKE